MEGSARTSSRLLFAMLVVWLTGCDAAVHRSDSGQDPESPAPETIDHEAPPRPAIAWAPKTYVAFRRSGPIRLDGRLSEESWDRAPWTDEFVDIEGPLRPHPELRTRARLLWDDERLWIGAELEEPHVWATLTERDAVIYLDDDFELFIDPDGDTHAYYELEVNALGTEWDLLLLRPYRDGGPAVHAWDIPGLRTAVHVDGTLNDPGDRDVGWSVEIAIPWDALAEATDVPSPPRPGDRWRLNFSRVDWPVETRGGRTAKKLDPDSGESLPESNWVWSPQGLIAMHYPEMWGFLEFSGAAGPGGAPSAETPAPQAGSAREAERSHIRESERAGWFLRQVYYAQHEHRARTGSFASSPESLAAGIEAGGFSLSGLEITRHGFEARVDLTDGSSIRIDHEGRLRFSP
jgi:hypothetical protein